MARQPLPALPIDPLLPTVIERLQIHPNLVLQAPPGAGKTTRLPPALLHALLKGPQGLVMLEPRRLAARAACQRIASEQGWTVGQEIGYQIRFERRASNKTRILIVTEGILIQMLNSDPFLEAFGLVLFDEFHERHLASDLALAMVRKVQQEVRPDLRTVVMSATLNPDPISGFLGDAPVLISQGRSFPVTTHYLQREDPRPPAARVASGVVRMLKEVEGDILAFLPGVGEIRRTEELLASTARELDLQIHQLFGDQSLVNQSESLSSGARRRIVLATNVAESSVTVEGIQAVVDSGLARVPRFDPGTGLDRLELQRISRASADQRKGRAGRLREGVCLRLWTEHDDRSLQPQEVPEILRVDLAAPCLQLLSWGENDPHRFSWYEAPETGTLDRALVLLTDLGAVDHTGLTGLGEKLAQIPLHPRLARLLVAGRELGLPRRAARAAALLSERDVVHRPGSGRPVVADTVSDSDLIDRLEALEQFADRGHGQTALGPIRADRARQVLRVSRQLERLSEKRLGPSKHPSSSSTDDLRRALFTAWPDRLARRREEGSSRAVMVGGRGVRLSPMSTVQQAPLFLCLELGDGRPGTHREASVRLASAVEIEFLEKEVRDETRAIFDRDRERVVGRRQRLYRNLVLEEVECDPGKEACEQVLREAAQEQLENALALDEPRVADLLVRLRCLADWRPDLNLPRFDDSELAEILPWLCAGKRSFAELRRAPLYESLIGQLSYEQQQALDREAPERLTVPSGSRIRLRYEIGQPPVLAARIQELFGWLETPTVAGGRVPVLLHLLAPNHRPQQITQDLRSFWTRTWPEVRKELQGRYPRHAWPEDPLNAKPEKRPRRRPRKL